MPTQKKNRVRSAPKGSSSSADPSGKGIQRWFIGVDVGGTFTDVVALEEVTGAMVIGKGLTTPDDPLAGIMQLLRIHFGTGLTELVESSGFLHGTTLPINTLIERKGAVVGLLTTMGFRDVIETGREDRYDLYDLQIEGPPSIVPRQLRLGVAERIGARGEVLRPLDLTSLKGALRQLRKAGVGAVAICFLNSYTNGEHETAVARLVATELPTAYVSRSSDVAPIIREYERFLATVVNSYIGPTVASYLGRVSEVLEGVGFVGQLGIMKSDGGVCSAEEASRYPVKMLESGPAAGAIFAAHLARTCQLPNVLSFDMGGTTAKACLVLDGTPILTDELEVDRRERLRKGSGLPLRLPSIDLMEIGAGGGSIAAIGPLGLLQVGPKSAGARPGPACYRLGGGKPTVTDADLLLGYLRPDSFSAGGPTLDSEAAARAVQNEVAEPLGVADLTLAAWAIHDLVNENMAQAARLHCVEHGIDPAGIWLVATGGAGPLHASGLFTKLDCLGVICPQSAGVASAIGLVLAPWTVERAVTDIHTLGSISVAEIESKLDEVERSLPLSGHARNKGVLSRFLYMRIRGQAYEVKVEVPRAISHDALGEAFRRSYLERFGMLTAYDELEIVSWGVRMVDQSGREISRSSYPDEKPRDTDVRQAFLGPEHGWMPVTVISYSSIRADETLKGPLLVEDVTTTIVIARDQEAFLDEMGNLRITRSQQ